MKKRGGFSNYEYLSEDVIKDRIINKHAKPVKTFGEIRPKDIVPVIAPSRSGRKAVFPGTKDGSRNTLYKLLCLIKFDYIIRNSLERTRLQC